jgi:hypothetical protein
VTCGPTSRRRGRWPRCRPTRKRHRATGAASVLRKPTRLGYCADMGTRGRQYVRGRPCAR